MREQLRKLIVAGAASAICRHHEEESGPDGPWEGTREFAMREFRDIDADLIEALVEYCKLACAAADAYNDDGNDRTDYTTLIPRIGAT